MGIGVTVYNDDKHGRLIQVVRLNSRTGKAFEHHIVKPSEDSDGGPLCIDITQDEILIVSPAEAVEPEPKEPKAA